jgi:hypothetical protein
MIMKKCDHQRNIIFRTFIEFPVTKATFNVRSCDGNVLVLLFMLGGLDDDDGDDDKATQNK